MRGGIVNIFAENLIAIGVSGTREQQIKMVNVMSHLLFTKTSNTSPEGSAMTNFGVLAIFFRTIDETNSVDLKSTLLSIIHSAFQIATPKEKEVMMTEWEMFSVLFNQFNEFSVSDRKLVSFFFYTYILFKSSDGVSLFCG